MLLADAHIVIQVLTAAAESCKAHYLNLSVGRDLALFSQLKSINSDTKALQ